MHYLCMYRIVDRDALYSQNNLVRNWIRNEHVTMSFLNGWTINLKKKQAIRFFSSAAWPARVKIVIKNLFPVAIYWTLGVKVRNMKMDFNIGVTWRRVGQWTLMMKIYEFFIRLSRLVALYNSIIICKKYSIFEMFLLHNYTGQLNDLAE